jgi:predicted lipid-binding transport protein (Tim44 family)
MQEIPYADLVILALIAGFIVLRLRSVLGSKSSDDFFGKKPSEQTKSRLETIIQLDEKSLKLKPREEPDTYLASLGSSPIADTIREVQEKDPQFTATRFLQGAKSAFEMVFDAFVKSDRQTLKMLMSDTIFRQFSRELDGRDGQENKSETTLVSVTPKEITHAALEKNTARFTVRFESEQVTVVRNPKGDIVEGDPSELHHSEDQWVFERDVTSKNPNWKIIET